MRFHCQECAKDFTTLSKENDKRAFSNLILDDMRCPYCGCSNREVKLAPLKHTRGRWQPKRRSRDTDEVFQPIVLSSICQSRVALTYGESMFEVVCDGCPSAFNCLTGNIDDGVVEPEDIKDKFKKIDEAKEKLLDKQKEEEKLRLKKIEDGLRNQGFAFVKLSDWYAKFRGTNWKLSDDDIKAITENTWHTPKTMTIKNTLTNHKIDSPKASELLSHLIGVDSKVGLC